MEGDLLWLSSNDPTLGLMWIGGDERTRRFSTSLRTGSGHGYVGTGKKKTKPNIGQGNKKDTTTTTMPVDDADGGWCRKIPKAEKRPQRKHTLIWASDTSLGWWVLAVVQETREGRKGTKGRRETYQVADHNLALADSTLRLGRGRLVVATSGLGALLNTTGRGRLGRASRATAGAAAVVASSLALVRQNVVERLVKLGRRHLEKCVWLTKSREKSGRKEWRICKR